MLAPPSRGSRIGRSAMAAHSLCPDFAWFLGEGGNAASGGLVAADVVRGYPAKATLNSCTLAGMAGRFGPALAFAGTPTNSDFLILGNSKTIIPDGGPCTIVIASRKTDATLRASLGFSTDISSSDDRARCACHMPYSDGTVYWDFGGSSEGTGRISVAGLVFDDDLWVFTAGARGHEIWQNGIKRASNTDTTTRVEQSSLDFHLGGYNPSTANDLAAYALLYVYRRQLSPTDCIDISVRPYRWLQGARPVVKRKPAGSGAFTQGVADTIALTETITRQTNKALAESIALSETLQPQTRRLLAEAVSLTEVAAKQIGKSLAEGVGLSENLTTVKAVLKSVADSITLTESLTRMVSKAQADSLVLTESVSRLTTRALAETVGLTEAEQRQARRTIAESLSLAESLVTSVVKLHQEAETVALTETLRRQTGRALGETVVLTEAETRQIGRAIQETLGLTETRIVQLARRASEQVALAELLDALFISGAPPPPSSFYVVRFRNEAFAGPRFVNETHKVSR